MIGYLGVPGAMVALPYRGGLSTSTDRPVSKTRTLGGKVKTLVGPRGRREWSVSVDLLGSIDTHGLLAVSQVKGPVSWYPADAAAGNMLSPQAVGFEPSPAGAYEGGLVALPDGSVARSVLNTEDRIIYPGQDGGSYGDVAVEPNEAISVGVWALGGLWVTGMWLDSSGGYISTPNGGVQSFSGWEWRQSVLTPPAGAAYYRPAFSRGLQYARPSVSRGPVAHDRPGRGCAKALVHGLSEALTVIAGDDAYGSIELTITEVG